jgi:predicted molibdopterin-dependent oxidoreductase YjgC
MGRKIFSDVKGETKARKQRRRDRKTTCAQCGKRADKGTKLLMCSRCKSVLKVIPESSRSLAHIPTG